MWTRWIHVHMLGIYFHCMSLSHTMWILTNANLLFLQRLFSQWMQLWHFKLVWMIVQERFKGNLRLQQTLKVSRYSGPSINQQIQHQPPYPVVRAKFIRDAVETDIVVLIRRAGCPLPSCSWSRVSNSRFKRVIPTRCHSLHCKEQCTCM